MGQRTRNRLAAWLVNLDSCYGFVQSARVGLAQAVSCELVVLNGALHASQAFLVRWRAGDGTPRDFDTPVSLTAAAPTAQIDADELAARGGVVTVEFSGTVSATAGSLGRIELWGEVEA